LGSDGNAWCFNCSDGYLTACICQNCKWTNLGPWGSGELEEHHFIPWMRIVRDSIRMWQGWDSPLLPPT
jgi:hypothetical protein